MSQLLIDFAIRFINLPVHELDSAIQAAMAELGNFTGADRFYVFAYDWEAKTTTNTHEWCAPAIKPEKDSLQNLPLENFGEWVTIHKQGETRVIQDVQKLPESDLRSILVSQSVQSLIAVPIMFEGRCLGFVGMDWVRQKKEISSQEEILLHLFSDMLANVRNRLEALNALERARADAETAKAALIASEEKYRSLINSSDAAITLYDVTGTLVLINRVAASHHGKTAQDLQGRTLRDLFPTEQANAILSEVQHVVATNEGLVTERPIDLPSRGNRWIRASMQPVRDPNGVPWGALISATDVTDRVAAVSELRRNEEKYRSLIDSSDAAIVMYDADGNVLYLNGIAAMPYGKKPEELVGLNVDMLFPPGQAESIRKDIRLTMAEGKGKVLETEVDLAARRHWFRTNIQPVRDPNGITYAVMMSATDITTSKEADIKVARSEKKYRNLFVESPEAYLILLDGIFIECNQASEELVGGTRTDILGRSPVEFSPELQPNGRKSAEYAQELIAEAWKKGDLSFEWTHLRVDQKPFVAFVNLTVIEFDDAPVLLVTWRDITERKKILEDLQLYQNRYSQAMTHSRAVVWETDLEGKFTYMSPVSMRVFGYQPLEIEGKMFFYDFHPADVRDFYRRRGFEIMQAAQPLERLDNPIVCKDGNVIWVSTIGVSLFDSNGHRTGYRCVVFDITDRRLAEQDALRFKAVLSQANYGAGINTLDGDFIFINEEFARMHGYTAAEMKGKSLSLFHTPEQLKVVGAVIKQMMETGGFSAVEIWHKHRDGSVFPTLMSGVVIKDETGKPAYISATVLEISEMKAKEAEIQKLSLAIEQSPVALVIADLDAIIRYVNPAFTKITGYESAEVVGKETRMLKSGMNPPELYEELWKTITSGNVWQGEWINKKKSGELYPESATILPIYDQAGKVMNYLGIKQDISDRRHAETEKIARQVAESANQMKSIFLANMSHEIRTPLNAVIGFAQILQRDKSLSDKQADQVSTILRSGEHLLSLINDILDLSKIEAGRITLKESGFSLRALLEDLRVMFMLRAAEKKLRLTLDLQPSVPEFISADEGKIRQVLVNLMGNAFKFTNEGGVTLHVFAEARKDAAPTDARQLELVMSIEDTGPGVPDQDQEKIFNAFQQSSAQNQNIGGTGLGLTISRRLAEIMGGTLTLKSQLGRGSAFTFRIPVLASRNILIKERQSEYNDVVSLLPGQAPVKILVADDVPENLQLVQAMLEPLGFEVRTAVNGREAVDQFLSWHPSAVIMDIRMPVMDGYEATKTIRSLPDGKGLPIIAITASAFEDDQRIKAAGFSAYVRKPFTLSQLLGEFVRHLHISYKQAEQSEPARELIEDPQALTAEKIPPDLRKAICDSVRSGNSVQLKALMQKLLPIDSALAEHSRSLVRRFDYDALLRLYE